MFSLNESLRYYLCIGSVSMRNGIDGLSGIIRNKLNRDPLSGEVFIFISSNRCNMKLLHWEKGGFVLYQKRLEAGKFELPEYDNNLSSYKMDWSTLVMLVEGIKLKRGRYSQRYNL